MGDSDNASAFIFSVDISTGSTTQFREGEVSGDI